MKTINGFDLTRWKAIELLDTLTEIKAIDNVVKGIKWYEFEDMITDINGDIYKEGFSDGFLDAINEMQKRLRGDKKNGNLSKMQ
jgi:hypothetical protein